MRPSGWVSAIKKTLRYSERDYEKRMAYVRDLRAIIKERGSGNIVYVDERALQVTATALMDGRKQDERFTANVPATIVPEPT